MEIKMYKFPDIEQFRNAIYNVKYRAQYAGKDENGDPIQDETLPLPILNYRGTVKMHGTNGGIVFTPDVNMVYGVHAQSRENIITPQKDNAGFATFIHTTPVHKLLGLITINGDINDIEGELPIIKVYGEWCGKGIQSKVGISKLEKMFVIVAVKVGDVWLAEEELKLVKLPEYKIYNICDYPSYRITIDFNNPQEAADKMGTLVENVEKECPVAKAFGVEGIGEGIVWTCIDKGWTESRFWFKTKGEEHKGSSTKEKVPVDVERVNSINELVNTIVAEGRLVQGLDYLRQENIPFEIKSLGTYIKWVYNDVIKEELDTIVKNGFEPKDISGNVSNKARKWFMDKLNEQAGI